MYQSSRLNLLTIYAVWNPGLFSWTDIPAGIEEKVFNNSACYCCIEEQRQNIYS